MVSVDELFQRAGAERKGAVPWGCTVPLGEPGVYVVATTPHGDEQLGFEECLLDLQAVDGLLGARPEVTIDGAAADGRRLADRLRQMWVPGQPVVYIGLASRSVATRVGQFYKTALGARAPHAGGWPVKMLRPQCLWVHYGASSDPNAVEKEMIRTFIDSVPPGVRNSLIDPNLPLPYANLEFPNGPRKRHGLSGVKEPRVSGRTRAQRHHVAPPAPEAEAVAANPPFRGMRQTQNVTANDLAKGTLRLPRSAKDIFPRERAVVWLVLGSNRVQASWDPRTSSDRERSGTLRIGRSALEGSVPIGGPRRIMSTDDGYRIE